MVNVKTTHTISKDKMNFRIIHHRPKDNPKKRKEIEKRLFEIFKKYEKC